MIIVVSDAFSNTFTGGAELTTDALLDFGFHNYKKIHSSTVDTATVNKYKDYKWIFGNFFNLSNAALYEVTKNVKEYSILEYDYKYCKFRLKSKHEKIDGVCDCHKTTRGKLIAVFFAKARNLFFMSHNQKREYESIFPFLSKKESVVLSSSFTEKTLSYIKSLNTKNKNKKYVILQSNFWVKGTEEAIQYAKENNLEYELVSGLKHRDLLKKLSLSKGLIFLPMGFDTCPRLTIEAKLLDCELILNENVQHKEEPWFQTKSSIIDYIEKQRELFYERCLKHRLPVGQKDEKTKFHFIVPSYNVEEWLPRCLRSIQRQEYKNYTVTVIDDVSSDKTLQAYEKIAAKDKKYKIIKNSTKKYALKNIESAINELDADDKDVLIVLDGDDWLSSPDVLGLLNKIYTEEQPLLTYGSYQYYPTGKRGIEPSVYPEKVINENDFRNDKWRASHLRTFQKKIWDKINKKDFIDNDGEYYKSAYDQAMMIPMLEMAGPRSRFVEEILHVYNRANVLNVDKIKQKKQYETMLRVRKKRKYEKVNFEN